MTAIWSFPIDTFPSVTGLLSGFDICRLWLSGDRRLMTRLESGGVTRFEIVLAQTTSRRWPTVISQFRRLEYLRIVPPTGDYRIWFHDVNFEGLSPTLKHLELDIGYLTSRLLGLPYAIPELDSDPMGPSTTVDILKMSPFDLENHFHNIQTIMFSDRMVASRLIIPMLPRTLLKLRLPYESISASTFQKLPPTLTHLELPLLRCLPDPPIFPSGLTHLELNGIRAIPPEHAAQFPTSLTYLDIGDCGNFSVITVLPTGLITLRLDCSYHSEEFPIERFPSLLHLFGQAPLRQNLKFLPYALQTLEIRHPDLSDDDIAILPRTLTSFKVAESELTSGCFQHFPPCLRILNTSLLSLTKPVPCPFLPSIEELELYNVSLDALQGAVKLCSLCAFRVEFSNTEQWDCFKSLAHLDAYGAPIRMENLVFPPSLTWLNGIVASSLSSQSFVSSSLLPRKMHYLDLQGPNLFQEDFLAQLPQDIRYLRLSSHAERGFISDAGVALLPRKIETLRLFPAEELTDNAIPLLPPNLTSLALSVRHSSSLLTSACVPHLPRHLTDLNLDDMEETNITTVAFDFLEENAGGSQRAVERFLRSLDEQID